MDAKRSNNIWVKSLQSRTNTYGKIVSINNPADNYWALGGALVGALTILTTSYMFIPSESSSDEESTKSSNKTSNTSTPGKKPSTRPDIYSTTSHPTVFAPPVAIPSVVTNKLLSESLPTSKRIKDSNGNVYDESYDYEPL